MGNEVSNLAVGRAESMLGGGGGGGGASSSSGPGKKEVPQGSPMLYGDDEVGRGLVALVEDVMSKWDGDRPAGMITGIVLPDGTTRIYSFGVQSPTVPYAPTPETVFFLASVSKLFTGCLLADAIMSDLVTLDTPLTSVLKVPVAPNSDHVITIRQLTTHTAGLPRIPPNMVNRSPRANPAATYEYNPHAYKFLANCVPDEPGKYVYSNIGVGLLGHALETLYGMPYEQAVKERILWPLGMSSAHILTPPRGYDPALHRAHGHNPKGRPVPDWKFAPALAPAGSWQMSMVDLLEFVRAQLGHSDAIKANPYLRDVFALARQQLRKTGPEEGIGMNWHLQYLEQPGAKHAGAKHAGAKHGPKHAPAAAEAPAADAEAAATAEPMGGAAAAAAAAPSGEQEDKQIMHWHNGKADAFASFLGVDVAAKVGVVVLCNQGLNMKPPLTGRVARRAMFWLRKLAAGTANVAAARSGAEPMSPEEAAAAGGEAGGEEGEAEPAAE